MLCSLSSLAQKTAFDSLVQKIDNKQIGIAMTYVFYPVMDSYAGDSLVKIGKQVTQRLVELLDDTSKGVIAHFILSNIWKEELKKAGRSVHQYVSTYFDKNVIVAFKSGLRFYYSDADKSYAEKVELERNKKEWQKFIEGIKHNKD